MKTQQILISGMGRMGHEIATLLKSEARSWYLSGYVSQTKKMPDEVPFFTPEQLVNALQDAPKKIDVVIDFSNPQLLGKTLKFCRREKIPLVSGTTALNEADFQILKEAAEDIPVLWSANMSLGIAVLKNAMKSLKAIAHYDFKIEEFHHNQKRDNPSGTAIELNAHLEGVLEKTLGRPIGIRGGGIFGIHTVYALGQEETLEFRHTALNRAVFARGALIAAQWLTGQKNGYYQIDDVLGLDAPA